MNDTQAQKRHMGTEQQDTAWFTYHQSVSNRHCIVVHSPNPNAAPWHFCYDTLEEAQACAQRQGVDFTELIDND